MAGTEGGRPDLARPELSTVKMSRLGVLQCSVSVTNISASLITSLAVSPASQGLPHLSIDFLYENTELRLSQQTDNGDSPSIGRTDSVAVVAEGLQRVVAHRGVAGDGLHDPNLSRPHVEGKVLVVS